MVGMEVTDDAYPLGQPRAEAFDRLIQDLLPKMRLLSPHLSEVDLLRATARVAEGRLNDEESIVWRGRL